MSEKGRKAATASLRRSTFSQAEAYSAYGGCAQPSLKKLQRGLSTQWDLNTYLNGEDN